MDVHGTKLARTLFTIATASLLTNLGEPLKRNVGLLRVMKTQSFLIPVIVSLILTPIALLLGVGSAGAGHGDYRLAMLLFPYTMLSTAVFDSITFPFIVLAIIQFPLYGIALGYANQRGRFGLFAILVGVVHGLAWVGTRSLTSINFS
jgi:hypothetical protein